MISICIPTRNAGAEFARNLRAWREQLIEEEVELLVVDSGSGDSTVVTARELGAQVHLIAPEEFNHGETRNLLAHQARGDFLVFTVQDARPANQSVLAELVAPLRQQPELAAVTGKQVPHPEADWVARWEVDFHNSVVEKGPLLKRLPSAASLTGGYLPRLRGLAFDNVCSALRRSVWEKHPFTRIDYGEDLEWAVRALRAGYSFLRRPSAQVYHSHNSPPYRRLKRSFVARRAVSRILELPPGIPPLTEEEILTGIGTYAAAVTALSDSVSVAIEPIISLRLPTGIFSLVRSFLRRLPLGSAQGLALRLCRNYAAEQLGGDFNAAMRSLLRFHGGLSRSATAFSSLQVGAQVLGTFLGDCAYSLEARGEKSDWLEEWGANLSRGV